MAYMTKKEWTKEHKGEFSHQEAEQEWKRIKEFRKFGPSMFKAIHYLNKTEPKFHKKR
jgi:hypothetical protein